jgi:hypothetical protein
MEPLLPPPVSGFRWPPSRIRHGHSWPNGDRALYACAHASFQADGDADDVSANATLTPAPRTVDVLIFGSAFAPNTLTIHVGDTVRWTNMDPTAYRDQRVRTKITRYRPARAPRNWCAHDHACRQLCLPLRQSSIDGSANYRYGVTHPIQAEAWRDETFQPSSEEGTRARSGRGAEGSQGGIGSASAPRFRRTFRRRRSSQVVA